MNRTHAEYAPDLPLSATPGVPPVAVTGMLQNASTSAVEIPGFLFRLAVTALSEGYPNTAAGHLRQAASHLANAAQHESDSQRRDSLLALARLVEHAAADSARYVRHQGRLDLIFAHVQLTLAHNQLQLANLAWAQGARQYTGCYLDSAIRQLVRARAWLNHTVPWLEDDRAVASDAQRIADALVEGWTVRRDRVDELIVQLDLDISILAETLHAAMPA